MSNLEEVMKQLPPALQGEVLDFARFLLQTQVKQVAMPKRTRPTFEWAGALRDLKPDYTSVTLQHAIADVRAGAVERNVEIRRRGIGRRNR